VLDEFAAEDLDDASAPAQSEIMLGLFAQAERLNAEVLRRAGPWERSGAWALDGAVTPTSWLRARAGLEAHEATELVRTARLAHDHEPTGEALRSGAVTTRKLHRIASAVKDRDAAYRENPDLLLDAAAALPPDAFSTVAKRWREAADDQLPGPRPTSGTNGATCTPRSPSPAWSRSTASSTPSAARCSSPRPTRWMLRIRRTDRNRHGRVRSAEPTCSSRSQRSRSIARFAAVAPP
jgi:hypothetical protein